MNTHEMTEHELVAIVGGDNAWMIWGEQAASNGLEWMDSGNPVKAAGALFTAAAGGYVYMIGLGWDMLFD